MRMMNIDQAAAGMTLVCLGVAAIVVGSIVSAPLSMTHALLFLCGGVIVFLGIQNFIRSIDWGDDED